MSSLIVPVATIDKVMVHDNSDNLDIVNVLGWQCVVSRGKYKSGDKIVYFPIDTILPVELSDQLGVTKFLKKGCIVCAKIRGEPSFGLVIDPANDSWEIGDNVADYYGATKYVPPVKISGSNAVPENSKFSRYTDVENLRHYPNIINNETVVVMEKIHGTNSRVGIVDGELVAGSRKLQRKGPEIVEDLSCYADILYWFPLSLPAVQDLIKYLNNTYQQVILYGEIFGPNVQKYDYGLSHNRLGYRLFDIMCDGKFLNWPTVEHLCHIYQVPIVPVLYTGNYDLETIKKLANGQAVTGGSHIREGVVVKPVIERHNPKIGRVILKYVSDAYLFGNTEDSTDQ